MRAQELLPLLLLPALALAGCSDQPEPTGLAPLSSPAFDHAATETCVVTSTADAGAETLRDAIDNHACVTITFDVTGTIELTTAQLTIQRSLTIAGPGADQLTIRRNAAAPFRIFEIMHGPVVEISGLTISGGACGVLHCTGGGILNIGRLTVTRSTISGNAALGGGGGIHNAADLTVTHSTISGNTSPAGVGGGIHAVLGSNTLVVHSTISGNTAATFGGGVYGDTDTRISVSHSTISDNSAPNEGGITGGSSLFPVTLRNTILARNGGGNCLSFSDSYDDAGYNLDDGTSCLFSASTSQSSTEPLIGALADNGGPTRTHALLAGSPAIDAGTCTDHLDSTVTDDQRGVTRPQGLACDIGAFELEVSVEDLLTALIALSEQTPGVSRGTVSKLRDALTHAARGRTTPACNALAEYIADLENQAGKPGKVSVQDAATLIEAAEQIRSLLGC